MDIYGKVRKFVGDKTFIPFRFQGQIEDEETGLYYNMFRYYCPGMGTYIRQDPVGLDGGDNLYAYVHDPNIWIDPYGLKTIRLRHYTSNKGLKGMQKDMKIKAYDQNTVFAERAKGKPLSSANAAKKYGINKSSARNYVEFDVDATRVTVTKNPRTKAIEYQVKGDIKLNKKTTKFVKRCK